MRLLIAILAGVGVIFGIIPECNGAVSQQITNTFRVSAYCGGECCCQKWAKYKTTASGHKIKSGDKFCAAPRNIPFGTMIYIPGYGRVPVLDRGGTIRGNRLDVYFDTHQEALDWGVQYLEVKIR